MAHQRRRRPNFRRQCFGNLLILLLFAVLSERLRPSQRTYTNEGPRKAGFVIAGSPAGCPGNFSTATTGTPEAPPQVAVFAMRAACEGVTLRLELDWLPSSIGASALSEQHFLNKNDTIVCFRMLLSLTLCRPIDLFNLLAEII